MSDFIDYVALGRALMQARNTNSWALGDLAVDFEIKVGRPSDEDAPTLSDLASAWDVETPRVSEWRSVAAFFPGNLRMNELSWSHHNLARRASGGDLEQALELLRIAAVMNMGVSAFRRYCAGMYFEGPVAVDALPIELQMLVPDGESLVWLTFGRDKRADG